MSSSAELSLKSFSCDPNYYAECFRVFNRHSSRTEEFTSWAETEFPRHVIDKLVLCSNEGQLEILGVGSGTGELDCKLIMQLSKKYRSISSTVLEPNQDHILGFQELVREKAFNNVVWNWLQQTWEQFYDEWKVTNGGNQKKFHFISAIHSLYHFTDTESAILNLISCLHEGGILMITLTSERGSMLHLWKQFPMLCSVENVKCINAGDVCNILEKHRIGYKSVTQDSNTDIACCYEDGNQEGVKLLDFLSQVKLRESAPQSFVNEVLSQLRKYAMQDGDRILYNNEWKTIFITK